MSVTPLVGKRGGAVVTHTNITKRKQVEEALQENEECLKLAMEAGDIGTFDWNIQTNEVSWTEQSKKHLANPIPHRAASTATGPCGLIRRTCLSARLP